MLDGIAILEKAGAIRFLIVLYESNKKINATELMKKASSNTTATKARVGELKECGLIEYEIKPTVKNGVVIGGSKTKWVWLTPKGKKVAKKLLEIEEIMEKEE